ncbi:MAG: hypothetical protein ACO39T_09355 [Flavobacteriaceae bacterium]|jgi:hypothetical protein
MKINIPRKATFLAAVITALISFFNTSCKPDEPEPKKYLGKFYIGDMRNYTYFKPGSMWVYECDSTGELDTQVMLKCYTWWISTDYIDCEVLSFQRKSLNEGSLYTDYASTYTINYNENFKKQGDWLNVEKSHSDINRCGKDNVFFTPFDTTKEYFTADGSSETTYKKLLTNYTVNNFTFDTVRVFMARRSNSNPMTNHPFFNDLYPATIVEYYFAKNVGIIQLNVTAYSRSLIKDKSHHWNLKYYKIVN